MPTCKLTKKNSTSFVMYFAFIFSEYITITPSAEALTETLLTETLPDDCSLCLSLNFEKLFRSPLLESTSVKRLISCTSCRISTTRYNKKVFHKSFSSILYQNKKWLFESAHLLKIAENYL